MSQKTFDARTKFYNKIMAKSEQLNKDIELLNKVDRKLQKGGYLRGGAAFADGPTFVPVRGTVPGIIPGDRTFKDAQTLALIKRKDIDKLHTDINANIQRLRTEAATLQAAGVNIGTIQTNLNNLFALIENIGNIQIQALSNFHCPNNQPPNIDSYTKPILYNAYHHICWANMKQVDYVDDIGDISLFAGAVAVDLDAAGNKDGISEADYNALLMSMHGNDAVANCLTVPAAP
jgi:hypothetical protein